MSVYTLCLVYLVLCLCVPCVSCTLSGVSVHTSCLVYLVACQCTLCVLCTVASLYTLCLVYLVWCLCTPVSRLPCLMSVYTCCLAPFVSVHLVSHVPCLVSVYTLCLVYLVLCQCTPCVFCTLSDVCVHTQCLCTPCLASVRTLCIVYPPCCLYAHGVFVHLVSVYTLSFVCVHLVSRVPCLVSLYTQSLRTSVSNLVWCLCTLQVSLYTLSCVCVCLVSRALSGVYVHIVSRVPCLVFIHVHTPCLCTRCLMSVCTLSRVPRPVRLCVYVVSGILSRISVHFLLCLLYTSHTSLCSITLLTSPLPPPPLHTHTLQEPV